MSDLPLSPGPILRDPRYQDLCAFFKTMPPGQDWRPRAGDWVVRRPGDGPGLVVEVAPDSARILPLDGQEPYHEAPEALTWLPTLDQLRTMMLEAFGTCGCFTGSFNGRAWWFGGHILGTTVTNLVPLAEGGSAEEAAINALLMRHVR